MAERQRPLARFYGLLTPALQRARLRAAAPYLGASPVLDVGCGLTDLPSRLAGYVGTDRDPDVLAECVRRHPAALFVPWDVGASPAPRDVAALGPYPLALMLAILEHLDEPEAAVARVSPLLAPGGRLVTTTPHPAGRALLEAGARIGLLSAHADEEHEDLLSLSRLASLGEAAGLALVGYRRFVLGLNQLAVFEKRS